MRIGITCYPTYGGSGVVATELGIELAKRGHEVRCLCLLFLISVIWIHGAYLVRFLGGQVTSNTNAWTGI